MIIRSGPAHPLDTLLSGYVGNARVWIVHELDNTACAVNLCSGAQRILATGSGRCMLVDRDQLAIDDGILLDLLQRLGDRHVVVANDQAVARE